MVCPHSVIRGKGARRCQPQEGASGIQDVGRRDGANCPTSSTRCRCRWKTARDVISAWRSVRPKTRATWDVRRSTWCRVSMWVTTPSPTGIFSRNCPNRLPLSATTEIFRRRKVKDVQLLQPLFEFSSACAGCGETPYLRLMSQLFGDRTVVGQRDGLLEYLRRQHAHHAVVGQRRRARARLEQLALRGQRRSLVWASGWRSTNSSSTGGELVAQLARCDRYEARRRNPRERSAVDGRDRSAERTRCKAEKQTHRSRRRSLYRSARGRRRTGTAQRVDRRRRRMGLRYWIRWPRPCALDRAQR